MKICTVICCVDFGAAANIEPKDLYRVVGIINLKKFVIRVTHLNRYLLL